LLQGRLSRDPVVVGERSPASVQSGPGAHPATYKMGTFCFLGIKRPVHVLDHPSCAKVEKGVEL